MTSTMQHLKQYWLAEALERSLGDPTRPDSLISFKRVVELDEVEAFPEAEVNWLYNWKLNHYFIPTDCGGEFTSFEEFIAFVRVLSRRDLTTAITFSTLFWSFLTWMAGSEAQKRQLASFIKDDNVAMCLSYSERSHGSDLVAGEVYAAKTPGGYLLNGEKWPINRATISGVTFVLAKTNEADGNRGLSLFMVPKRDLDPAAYSHSPKIKTHGIRGSDMSGIEFNHCFISEDTRLGPEGAGLELALKGFQITRALCAAFSQGAADTALRTTLNFSLHRRLYGKTVFDLPQPRQTLVNAFLDILICDCVNIGAGRGFHTAPEQFSVWSAVVKYFVPTTLERLVQDVSVVLGARYYMREEHDWGVFQKMLRDTAIISVFDGSTVVNLHALILQRRQLAKNRKKSHKELFNRLKTSFSLAAPLPRFAPDKLELFSRGKDDVLQGLPLALKQLQVLENATDVNSAVLAQVISLTAAVLEELDAQDQHWLQGSFEYGHEQSPEAFELAQQYCMLHAAAACIHMWIYNRTALGRFFAQGEWLVLCLRRLLKPLRRSQDTVPQSYTDNVAEELLRLHEQTRLFSIAPFQLAQSEPERDSAETAVGLQMQS